MLITLNSVGGHQECKSEYLRCINNGDVIFRGRKITWLSFRCLQSNRLEFLDLCLTMNVFCFKCNQKL